MRLWLDAQLSPALATWFRATFGLDATAIRDLGLREARDIDIFHAARQVDASIMTKDSDFVDLVQRLGPPPQVIWITCGNTSNACLQQVLIRSFPTAKTLLDQGEPLVEITDAR